MRTDITGWEILGQEAKFEGPQLILELGAFCVVFRVIFSSLVLYFLALFYILFYNGRKRKGREQEPKALRFSYCKKYKKNRSLLGPVSLVHEVGLEPTRPCEHRHLKPASLPIPPLVQSGLVRHE